MVRKTYYTIYKTTNKINGKIYIGMHETNDLNDGYLGSGTYFQRALKKHGEAAFAKEILFIFDNRYDMLCKEGELVTEDFVKRKDTYNIAEGGMGGFNHINNDPEVWWKSIHNRDPAQFKAAARVGGNRCVELKVGIHDPIIAATHKKNMQIRKVGVYDPDVRKKGSEAALALEARVKQKQSLANIKHQQGKKNSQHGTCWITNGTVNIKIKKTAHIPKGYHKGRTMKRLGKRR